MTVAAEIDPRNPTSYQLEFHRRCMEARKRILHKAARRAAEIVRLKKQAEALSEVMAKNVPQDQPESLDTLLARVASERTFNANPGRVSTRDIQREVCRHYGVSFTDLISARRTASVTLPRQVAMYLAREMTTLSLPGIGRLFGDRDHTTVMHGHLKIKDALLSDENLRAHVDVIRAKLVPAAAEEVA